MRYRRKADDNQKAIVTALRLLGASVQPLHAVGGGVPDLLVGFRGYNILLEVKNPDGRDKEEPDQVDWARKWAGQRQTVRTPEEAVEYVSRYS